MTIALAPCFGAGQQFFDDNGDPLAGGLLYVYTAGTTAPATTYTSYTGGATQANPIVLDAAGRVPEEVWITVGSSYKFVLKTAAYVEVWTKDYISVYTPTDALVALANTSDATKGDALIGFKQSSSGGVLTGAVAGTVHTKLQEYVSVRDFGAKGDGVADDHDAIVLAIKSGRCVHFPAGTYLIKSSVLVSSQSNFEVIGDGIGATVLKADQTLAAPVLDFEQCSHFRVAYMTFDGDNSSALASSGEPVVKLYKGVVPVIERCEFIKHPVVGLYLINNAQFKLLNNHFAYPNPRGDITNYNLNVGTYNDTVNGYNRDGVISGNYSYGSQCCVYGKYITIANNVFTASKYGSGLTTGAGNPNDDPNNANYGPYTVTNNAAYNNTGYDKDNVDVCGMELDGWNNTITGNLCMQNGGSGMILFGQNGCVTGNYCGGNGTNVTSIHPAIDDKHRSGIYVYRWTTYGASYSLIASNKCMDLGASTQLYGYYEFTGESGGVPYLSNMTVAANHFGNNVTAPTYLHAANGAYEMYDWTAWTPAVTSGSGTITKKSVEAKYILRARMVFFQAKFYIETKGTAANALLFSLPTPKVAVCYTETCGSGLHDSGNLGLAVRIKNDGYGYVYKVDGSTPFLGDGDVIRVSGFYESQ